MNSYVTGAIIRRLREKENLTQSELADILVVSNKTVSKWEKGKGLPDISLLEPLATALNVSLIELVSGNVVSNKNVSANLIKSAWYVCPICGNVIHAMGNAVISCCGITLPVLEVEEECTNHEIVVEKIDEEYVVTVEHPMEKQHYICFIAYLTEDKLQVVKLYPEQEAKSRFRICGRGYFYCYCNHHGLFARRS